MSAFGPGDHQRFCAIDGWTNDHGKVWTKRLPDGRVLRTVVHMHRTEYGPDLRSQVLRQIAVGEDEFRAVLASGEPADRPGEGPVISDVATQPPEWAIQRLTMIGFTDLEGLSSDEAEDLVNHYFSLPKELSNEDVQSVLLQRLAARRSEN